MSPMLTPDLSTWVREKSVGPSCFYRSCKHSGGGNGGRRVLEFVGKGKEGNKRKMNGEIDYY